MKHAIIAPITKPTGGYRPISLLSQMVKVVERIVTWRLDSTLPIAHRQYGCRSGVSVEAVLYQFTHSAMAPGHTIALFFDVSKAYDRVNPAIILTKLIDAEAPPWIIHFISQFCSNRTFQVRHREILSAKHSPLFSIP